VHSRDAAKDTLDIIKETKAYEVGGVIHCFSYGPELAREYVNMGYYIGIGGVVTFKNGRKLKEVVESTPLERIVLETDCPYLAPVPFRGKRNDSTKLIYVVDGIAQIKGVSKEEVMNITMDNALKMYRI
jgi:TatD DNase family protein